MALNTILKNISQITKSEYDYLLQTTHHNCLQLYLSLELEIEYFHGYLINRLFISLYNRFLVVAIYYLLYNTKFVCKDAVGKNPMAFSHVR